jgi:hypothetical protein
MTTGFGGEYWSRRQVVRKCNIITSPQTISGFNVKEQTIITIIIIDNNNNANNAVKHRHSEKKFPV